MYCANKLMAAGIFIFVSFIGSYLLTGAIYRYAETLSLIDIPETRSSHSSPTPRGGGLAIVISYILCSLLVISNTSALFSPYWYLSALLLTAFIGFWDDLRGVPVRWRLPVHFAAALLLAVPFHGNSDILPFWGTGSGRLFATLVIVISLVWLLNLYNFMDGIDGIAAVETISVSIGGAAILLFAGQGQLAVLLLFLAAGSGGFLLWNWPPAKIFMGDVGSGFLGLALGGIALYSMSGSNRLTVWPWLILLGVFVIDATYTLARRISGGERWYIAHRSHAYQHAAARYKSHRKVTLSVVWINVFWLSPLAFLAVRFPEIGIYLTVLAFIPLAVLAYYFQAGNPEGER